MTRNEKWLLEEKYAGVQSAAFEKDCARLKKGEPLAYLIGHQPFLGLTIYLDSKPLIPRSETEWWTNELLNRLNTQKPIRFLDLCSGSGAIGCAALSRLPHTDVYFGEIDSAHGQTIRKNILENKLDESRAFIKIGDLFTPFGDMRFDVIAANPPYIPHERELPKSVSSYEPHAALFAGADGLEIIRRIAFDLQNRLTPDGEAWIECDEEHAFQAQALFEENGFIVHIRTDQFGKLRVLVVSFR